MCTNCVSRTYRGVDGNPPSLILLNVPAYLSTSEKLRQEVSRCISTYGTKLPFEENSDNSHPRCHYQAPSRNGGFDSAAFKAEEHEKEHCARSQYQRSQRILFLLHQSYQRHNQESLPASQLGS